jgi:serine/threonine-protein kinase
VSTAAETAELEPCPACGRHNPTDSRFCAACGLQLIRDDEVGEPGAPGSIADPLVGRIIADRYRILSLIGRGGMGVVYKVEHIHIGKLMAMKLLHGELARDRDVVKRFKREAEAASHLSHANTVQIFDFGRDQGMMFLVMEYLEGRDFGQIIQAEGPLPLARVARICAQVCASVAEAHAKGIIHRDLKPENVMVVQGRDRPDAVKVLDFGLAKLRHHDSGQSLTHAGAIIGTPYYMAPEHIRGENVDPRSDVYSVGAMMYKALAGVPPFWASTPMGVLTKHLTEKALPPSERSSRRDLPEAADRIVMKAMEKDAEKRYQRMEDLRRDLVEYLVSIGEDVADSGISMPSQPGTEVETPSGRRHVVPVATRVDVDRYEKKIKRKSRFGGLLVALLIAGAAAGAWWLWQRTSPVFVPSSESEPNDDPNEADRLPHGVGVRGQIGKRQSGQIGDADVYVIDNPGGERRAIRVEVTEIPNMDIVVDVVRSGIETPVLSADSGGVGLPEVVPNFPLSGTRYYLRVRERWMRGEFPTENVSDTYVIRWTAIDPGPEDEVEVNDSLELAGSITLGSRRRGWIGWRGDIDTFCLDDDAVAVTASVSGVPGLDVVLRVVDRATSTSRKVDQGGPGEPEQSDTVGRARAGETCFEISAADVPGAAASNPDERWTLLVEAARGVAP